MAGKKKPLWKSLTIQASLLIAVLVLARVFFPDQFSDQLFESLLAILGFTGAVGVRRALPILILCVMPFGLTHCGPSLCDKAVVEITDHPTLKSPPAGTVTIKCCNDGECKDKAKINTKEVTK
tara:strand:+ start:572 stop:940 length:369 start_codon:yes stop_codon:yes gene_type:complete